MYIYIYTIYIHYILYILFKYGEISEREVCEELLDTVTGVLLLLSFHGKSSNFSDCVKTNNRAIPQNY